MTNQQILTKAIEKAIAGGWDKIDSLTFSRAWANERADHIKFNAFETGNAEIGGVTFDLNTVIFDRDFAKALWGKGDNTTVKVGNIYRPKKASWQNYLQQMVIADDPIKYLGENLG